MGNCMDERKDTTYTFPTRPLFDTKPKQQFKSRKPSQKDLNEINRLFISTSCLKLIVIIGNRIGSGQGQWVWGRSVCIYHRK
jgi:hypothetical protein